MATLVVGRIALGMFLGSCCAGLCQQPNTTPPIISRVRTIDLTRVAALPGLPAASILGYPTHCSSDGDIYLEIYGKPPDGKVGIFPDLYRIARDRTVTLIPRPTPHQNFGEFVTRSFYPGAHTLVSLLQAFHPLGDQANSPTRQRYFFLSVTDQNGDHGRLIRLTSNSTPFQVAVLPSGQFLVLGMDPEHRTTVALLAEDGTFVRDLAFGSDFQGEARPSSPNTNANSASTEAARVRGLGKALSGTEFQSWGDDVVLVSPGADARIYRIGEGGEFDVIQPHLPSGYVVQGILGAGDRDTWVLRVTKSSTADELTKKGVIENPPEYLVEVNPSDGTLLRELDVKGPHPGEVACAANGKLEAVYYGAEPQPGLPDQLTLASDWR